MKKIAIVTDTAYPDVNGVATTINQTQRELEQRGYDVRCFSPSKFCSIKGIRTSDVRITINPWKLFEQLTDYDPDALHISTEGTLGIAAQLWARKRNFKFTTAYHTDWAVWWKKNFWIGSTVVQKYLNAFHRRASSVLCATPALMNNVRKFGANPVTWSRGVDFNKFDQGTRVAMEQNPVWLFVGRVSAEKNIEDFLRLDLPGTKVVVGTGPQLDVLKKKYSGVEFVGEKIGVELANYYHSADVFVFPSEFDTFGLVMIEAIACGTPVAAKPVANAQHIIEPGISGYLNWDLKQACLDCLKLDRSAVYRARNRFSWSTATDHFLDALIFNK